MDKQLTLVEFQPRSSVCAGCVALMAVLCSFDSGVVWLAQDELGLRIGRGSRTVRRHLDHLIDEGAITVRRQGQGRPNVYTVVAESVGAALRDVTRAPRRVRSSVTGPDRTSVTDKHSPRTSYSGNTKKADIAPRRAACAASPRKNRKETIAIVTPTAIPEIATGDEAPALIEALERHGVDSRAARTFVATVPMKAILQQIRWLPDRKAQNAGAVLAESIRHGYAEPARARCERLRAEASAAAEARRAAQEIAAVALQDQESAEVQELAAAEEALSPARRCEIRAAVEREYYASLPARIREATRGGVGARAAIEARCVRATIAAYRAERSGESASGPFAEASGAGAQTAVFSSV